VPAAQPARRPASGACHPARPAGLAAGSGRAAGRTPAASPTGCRNAPAARHPQRSTVATRRRGAPGAASWPPAWRRSGSPAAPRDL